MIRDLLHTTHKLTLKFNICMDIQLFLHIYLSYIFGIIFGFASQIRSLLSNRGFSDTDLTKSLRVNVLSVHV